VGSDNALSQLRRRIAATEPNTTVHVDLVRGSRRLTVDVTLVKREDSHR
jgi:S1-C subfamily serine protease